MKILRKVKRMLDSNAPSPTTISLGDTTIQMPNIIDASKVNGYLAGQLLVATPVIESGAFMKSVIYVFNHSASGAMGLIINQPLELINYNALLEGMNLPKDSPASEIPVYFGGPVERTRGFVVHSTDYLRDFTLARSNELAITASSAILGDIAEGKGPKNSALIVGYAGWSAGQLEAEIEQNSWISVPATEKLMFETDNDLKWATASKSLGIDMAFFSTTIGHA